MSTYQPITPIILAGGLGTRLLPAVADRLFLSYLLDQLIDAGMSHPVLCTGHLHNQIFAAFGTSYRDGALTLRYS